MQSAGLRQRSKVILSILPFDFLFIKIIFIPLDRRPLSPSVGLIKPSEVFPRRRLQYVSTFFNFLFFFPPGKIIFRLDFFSLVLSMGLPSPSPPPHPPAHPSTVNFRLLVLRSFIKNSRVLCIITRAC